MLLQHVPIVRELLGRGRKRVRPEAPPRRVVLLPGATLQLPAKKAQTEKTGETRAEEPGPLGGGARLRGAATTA